MKILVVEDDKAVAKTLQILLLSYNYAVDVAFEGNTGLQMADAYDYDLFLLDVMLPDLDGVSLCKQLRSKGCQSPILLLTGQGETQKKAIALNNGADDYVVKPFDPEELIARIQALLRRSGPIHQTILSWGQLSIDPSTCKVAYGTQLVKVSPKEYGILEFLLRKPQQVRSAHAILEHVWNSLDMPGEDVVRSHIKDLRRTLRALGAPKDFIKTIYRVGYQLNPLYASLPTPKGTEQPTLPQVAELNAVNEELRTTLEKLRSTQAKLQQKHQELEVAYQTIAWERQQLKVAHHELGQRVADRTAELVAANQTLQQQRDQWQALFEHALDAIAITDDNGNYLDVNPAACQLLGASKVEVLRSRVSRFAESGLAVKHAWETLRQQGQLSDEFRIIRPDGTIRDVEFNAIANFVPGRHLLIMRDVSEKKRHEVERQQALLRLKESERKLSTLINNLPGYVYRVANDLNYTPEFISEGVFNITGYSQADYLVYRTSSCGQEMHPDDVDWVWDRVQQAVENHQPYECEYRILTRSGEQKWVWRRGQGVYANDGKLLYLEGFVTDITSRKHLELSLQSPEAKLNRILGSTIATIASFQVFDNRDWDYEYWSAGCTRLFGYTASELMADKTLWLSRVFPDDRETILMPLFEQFFAEQDVTVEYRFYHKDASLRWISSRFTSQRVGDRSWIVTALSQDITDRKQAELELLHTQATMRQQLAEIETIYQSAPIGLNVLDRDLRFLRINRQLAEINGLPVEAHIGRTIREVLPELADTAEQILRPLLTTGQPLLNVEIQGETPAHPGVQRIWLESFVPLKDGDQVIGISTVCQEITEPRQIEQQLQESEERFRTLSTAAPIGICQTNTAGHCLYVNDHWQQLTGFSLADSLGDGWRQAVHPQDRPLLNAAWATYRQGEKPYDLELRLLTPQGETRWVATRIAAMQAHTGEIMGYVNTYTDVTDRRQAEQAQRLEGLGILASGIAHDLNNVLTPILAISKLLRLQLPNLEVRFQEMLQVLEESAQRGAGLIKQILILTQTIDDERSLVQIAPLIQDVLQLIQPTLPDPIALQATLPDPAPSWLVAADATYLQQAFLALCVNAREAMPTGGTLSLTLDSCEVDEGLAQANRGAAVGEYVVVTIADTGVGIPPAAQAHLFDPFFTTKAPGQGTSLGLAIVRGIIKSYGGFLQVFSEVGQGTQIKVYLPIAQRPHGSITASRLPNPDDREAPPVGQGERVLIVDDDPDVLATTQTLLEHYHYAVLAASDGLSAIELYTQHQADIRLVVLDITMPDMDGITVIQRLKAINPQVEIIAISGRPTQREPALAAGASLFLAKPYTLDSLLEQIHTRLTVAQ